MLELAHVVIMYGSFPSSVLFLLFIFEDESTPRAQRASSVDAPTATSFRLFYTRGFHFRVIHVEIFIRNRREVVAGGRQPNMQIVYFFRP